MKREIVRAYVRVCVCVYVIKSQIICTGFLLAQLDALKNKNSIL